MAPAERGKIVAKRLNPLHPGWYGYYGSRILFLLGRYEEAAAILEEGYERGSFAASSGSCVVGGGLRSPGAN
jgi:hypothetical protein